MWAVENRGRYKREHLRYPSAVTAEEGAEIAPRIAPARRGGRKRTVDIRAVFKGFLDVLSTGCQGRAIPKALPPRGTSCDYFTRGQAEGTLGRIHPALYVKCREQQGRAGSPTAGILASQSVKGAEKGGARLSHRALRRVTESKEKSDTG